MHRLIHMPVCAALVIAAIPVLAQTPPRTNEPKLWFVLSALRKEATEAWRSDTGWPRQEADFAREMGWTMSRADLVRGLSSTVDREPAIDGYVKWQLLSFADNLDGLGSSELNRIVRKAPKPLPQPVVREEWLRLSGPTSSFIVITRQVPYVRNVRPVVGNGAVGLNPEIGVIDTGAVLGVEGSTKSHITIIREADAKLADARAKVTRANASILRYRRELMARAPKDEGYRFGLMLQDAADRLAAGDPSVPEAVEVLLEESESIPEDLSPKQRAVLSAWVRQLGQMKTTVHDKLEPGEREMQVFVHTHDVFVPNNDIAKLLLRLRADGSDGQG